MRAAICSPRSSCRKWPAPSSGGSSSAFGSCEAITSAARRPKIGSLSEKSTSVGRSNDAQPLAHVEHRGRRRVLRARRHELGEHRDPDPGLRDGERGVVACDHVVRCRLDERQPHELAGDDVRADAAHERLEAQPFLVRSPRPDTGVEDDQPRHAVGLGDAQTETDRAAPVLHDDGQVLEIELTHEPLDRFVVPVVRVPVAVGRLVGASEAEVVRRDASRDTCERRDHLSIQERPGRLAVQEQDRITAALVDVVHAQSVLVDVVRRERVARKALEPFVRRAVRVDAHGGSSSRRFEHDALGGPQRQLGGDVRPHGLVDPDVALRLARRDTSGARAPGGRPRRPAACPGAAPARLRLSARTRARATPRRPPTPRAGARPRARAPRGSGRRRSTCGGPGSPARRGRSGAEGGAGGGPARPRADRAAAGSRRRSRRGGSPRRRTRAR